MLRGATSRSPAAFTNTLQQARRWRATDKELRARAAAQTDLNSTVVIYPAFFCFLVGTLFFYDIDPEGTRERSLITRAADPSREETVPPAPSESAVVVDRTAGYLKPPLSLVPPQTDSDRRA